jgi:adenylosuccinate lyase
MRGLSKVGLDADRLAADLEAHPEVLAEAIQTILRAEGHPNPYEAMKTLTRGHQVTVQALRDAATAMMPEKADVWASLSPATYIGLAPALTDRFVFKVDATLPLLRQSWRQ